MPYFHFFVDLDYRKKKKRTSAWIEQHATIPSEARTCAQVVYVQQRILESRCPLTSRKLDTNVDARYPNLIYRDLAFIQGLFL